MKRALSLLVLVILGGGLVLAQTTVDVTWDTYRGSVSGLFQAGDDVLIRFATMGAHIFGYFNGVDYDNNPYNYGVDNVRARFRGNIEDGGYLEFLMERQDSWVPMYGPAGQVTYTYLETSDQGFFATQTRTNYADMITHNYGFQANSQWTASGDFYIKHYIQAANPLYKAGFYTRGNGSIDVTLMSSEVRGESRWRFGEGAGCYTNAHASGTGSGYFIIYGAAPSQINAFGATVGGGYVALMINYNNGFTTANNLNMSGQ